MNKNIWVKRTDENMEYYIIGSSQPSTKLFDKEELKKETILGIKKDKGYPARDWGDIFEVAYPSEDMVDGACELPVGIYRFKYSSGSLPSRFEKMKVRDESYIPLEDHRGLLTDIERFLKCKSLYEQLNFSYRRGYLLYGEPGTGKTAFIRNMIQQSIFSNMHIIWVTDVPPTSFINALNSIKGQKVLVMEELLGENGMLSYDMKELLEFLDGENSLKDCITIGTTNYPQFLHKNLADRPSRFDVLYEMKAQPPSVMRTILEKWLGHEVKEDEFDFAKFSLAELKEIVLLHKFNSISLNEAAIKLKTQSELFKRGFENKKGSFGLQDE